MTPITASILALDPAQHCGWAHSAGPSGVWRLGPPGPEHAGARLSELRACLEVTHQRMPFELLYAEDAAYGARHQFAVQLGHAEYRGIIRAVAHDLGVRLIVLNPATWKSFLTGSARADKDQVKRALVTLFGLRIADDNEADAVAILRCGLAGVTGPAHPKAKSARPRGAKKPKEARLFR